MFILLNTSHINGSERQLGHVLEILREKGWRVAPGNPETWPLSIEDREIFEWHLEEAAEQARAELAVSTVDDAQVQMKQALLQMRSEGLGTSFPL
ncbi:MAG: hypothetical protein DWQ07_19460 [Chloroflexi bacterium]|nr:MAG: hypothetical protein DWQ07_19460 [Chloroflexota bacterium]MBL1194260.1 hypothetical protein [Chloroflexota bacterium]NOH11552.1 hypothetical protein [Chloroflexota bacterium]